MHTQNITTAPEAWIVSEVVELAVGRTTLRASLLTAAAAKTPTCKDFLVEAVRRWVEQNANTEHRTVYLRALGARLPNQARSCAVLNADGLPIAGSLDASTLAALWADRETGTAQVDSSTVVDLTIHYPRHAVRFTPEGTAQLMGPSGFLMTAGFVTYEDELGRTVVWKSRTGEHTVGDIIS